MIDKILNRDTHLLHRWEAYYKERDKHISETNRVMWPCCKCGQIFYAHCGLDISPKYGSIVSDEQKT